MAVSLVHVQLDFDMKRFVGVRDEPVYVWKNAESERSTEDLNDSKIPRNFLLNSIESGEPVIYL